MRLDQILTSVRVIKTLVQLKHNPLNAIFNLGILNTFDERCPFVGITIGHFLGQRLRLVTDFEYKLEHPFAAHADKNKFNKEASRIVVSIMHYQTFGNLIE